MSASIATLNADIEAAAESLRDTMVQLRALARGEGANLSRKMLQHIDASLSASDTEFSKLRARLDSQQVTEALVIERADLYLAAWSWERRVRRTIITTRQQIRAARVMAAQLANGLALRLHTVREGETLQSIAQQALGDWREWTRILDANDLDPASPLAPGTHLTIPPKR